MNNLTVIVTYDNKEVARFENQNSDIEGFKYLLRNQGQSTSHAVKYEGWDVVITDNETKLITKYSDEYKKLHPKSKK